MNNNKKIASFAERNILVKLSLRGFGGQKTHKEASNKITKENNSENGFAKVITKLSNYSSIKLIQTEFQKARNVHKKFSGKWSEDFDIVSCQAFSRYSVALDSAVESINSAVKELTEDKGYEDLKRWASTKLGGLYQEESFPSQSTIKESFAVTRKVSQIANLEDWRINQFDAAVQSALIEQAQNDFGDKMKDSILDLLSRLLHEAQSIVDKLDRKSSTLQNRTLKNCLETVEIVRELNPTGDKDIENLCDKVEKLGKIDPVLIRESDMEKAEVVKNAKKAVEDIENIMGGVF